MSKVQTPKARMPAAASDMDAHDRSLLSLGSDTDANNGQTLHLGSELPDVPAEGGEAQTSDLPSNKASTSSALRRTRPTSDTVMGANNSHEEISAAVRATAAELHGRSALPKTDGNTKRTSTGKLKRVSNGAATKQTLYKNPVHPPVVPQRRLLQPSRVIHPDAYDIEEPTEEPSRLAPKPLPSRAISPTKKQKKALMRVPTSPAEKELQETRAKQQQMIDAQLVGADTAEEPRQEIRSSPRRPRRRQEAQEQDQPEVDDGTELGTQAAREKVWFRDPVSPQTRRSAVSVEVPVDTPEDDGTAEDMGLPEEQEVDAGAAEEQDDIPEQAPPKRKRGRPRGSGTTKPGGSREGETAVSSTRPHDKSNARKLAVTADTASKQAASRSPQKPKKQNSARAQKSINARRAEHEEHETRGTAQSEPVGLEDTIAVAGRASHAFVRDGDDGIEDDYQPENEEEEVDEAEDEDGDAEASEHNGRAIPPQHVSKKAVTLAPGEVFDGATGNAFASSSPEKDNRQRPQKRKQRSDDDSATTANTSKKRCGTASQPPANRDVSEEPDEEEPVGSVRRFYGQWRALLGIFRAVKKIGVSISEGVRQPQRAIKLADPEIKDIVSSCDEAIEQLAEGQDPATTLAAISEDVDALYEADGDLPPDFDNELKMKNIYAHLFPKLLELLRTLITTYESTDNGKLAENAYTTISIGHLGTVNGLISLILDLGAEIKDKAKHVKVHPSLALVKPVRDDILAPLKKIYTALRRVVQQHYRDESYKTHQQREAEERALATQREEQEERRTVHVRRARDKWARLHEERTWAEGGIMSAPKRRHLKLPDPLPEVDQNGVRFERLEVFTPRVGPEPAMVEAARNEVWTMKQLDALAEGLKAYKGPNVFEKIFRRYCGKHGSLNPYNVTQIVTIAAWLKEYIATSQQEQRGEVEDWVKAIPVWTKGHPLGKENTEGQADDGGGVES
ncbi:hypothetical protein LTR85_002532 [Meristemomyces frigidus]|nr:hypothetical protein LTR85_002532 [Meristemomyces frigidus]